jgi:hypothetical protein
MPTKMNRRAKMVVLLVFIAVSVVANFGFEWLAGRSAEKIMACAVGQAWACPTESIVVTALGPATYRFVGCGREATYRCKMPGEGCFLKGSETEALSVRACDK